jgi:adrenodoxin-NADP+ reductase
MKAMRRFLLLYGQRVHTRGFSSATRDPLHICVVGSGPAGFYTAEKVQFCCRFLVMNLFSFTV